MKRKCCFITGLITCITLLVAFAPAQDANKTIAPTGRMEVPSAIERSPEQMDAFDATTLAPTGNHEVAFRPTISEAEYLTYKNAAALAPHGMRAGAEAPQLQAPRTSLKFQAATQCDGDSLSFGCWAPPDVGGAIGRTQFVAVSNNMFQVFSRTGVLQKTRSLNSLCAGYSAQAMFDPRVQWDELWQRWVITADAFAENSTTQFFCVAVSKTSSATGAFWVYLINTNFLGGAGSFYDFPMLGMQQDALIFTANVFLPNNGFQGSSLFSWPKAKVYNGFGFSYKFFTGLVATMQPAHQVLTDSNPCAWLAAAPSNNSSLFMVALCNPGNPGYETLNGYYTPGVGAYSVPPAAPQPSSCTTTTSLDTSDNRFVNAGTQNGDSFYQVHTVNDAGFATPRYYVLTGLNSFAPVVSVENFVFASGTSSDFNASIASDPAGHFGLNWSYTDAGPGVEASERFTDNSAGSPAGVSGITVVNSASCYNSSTAGSVARWGDYSSTTLDPGTGAISSTATKTFWIDNETIPSSNFWSTEAAKETY